MTLELLPNRAVQDVLRDLLAAVDRAESVRAAVAYWTISAEDAGLTSARLRRLSGDGFLCVDLHWPTNVDLLAELHAGGAAVYLYLNQAGPRIETDADHPEKMPAALMHTKMWLFESESGAELWVGSHNFTRRAMTGTNLEATLVHRAGLDDATCGSAARMLDQIRGFCVSFDPTKIDYYKWLQGLAATRVRVLQLEGTNMLGLGGTRVLLLTEDAEVWEDLPRLAAPMHVVAIDDAGGDAVYDAVVTKAGDVVPDDRRGQPLTFHDLRTARIEARPVARLGDRVQVVRADQEPGLVAWAEIALSASRLTRADLNAVPRLPWKGNSEAHEQVERVGARELLAERRAPLILMPPAHDRDEHLPLADLARDEMARFQMSPDQARRGDGETIRSPFRRAIIRETRPTERGERGEEPI